MASLFALIGVMFFSGLTSLHADLSNALNHTVHTLTIDTSVTTQCTKSEDNTRIYFVSCSGFF